MSELQRAAASSYTPATVQRRAKLAAAGLSAVLSLGKQRLFFFVWDLHLRPLEKDYIRRKWYIPANTLTLVR